MSVQAPAPPAPPLSAPPAPEPPATPKISVPEYFALERVSEIRYEYVDGEIIPMPGESLTHNRIALNFSILLDRAFEDRDCVVYIESVRLRVSPAKYRYPDVLALCGEPVTDGDNPPALLNPALIVEVLSPSTQAIDQGEKFFEYWQIPGLTDYVLVAQDAMSVTHCVRHNPRQWTATEYTGLADTLMFASLGVTLTLSDVYRKVVFPAPVATVTAAPSA
jgi:Uma2 family endonuclease